MLSWERQKWTFCNTHIQGNIKQQKEDTPKYKDNP